MDFWSQFWANLFSPGSALPNGQSSATAAAANKVKNDPAAAAQAALQQIFGPLVAAMGPVLVKAGIFLIALVLVIVGFIVVASPASSAQ